MDIELLGGLVIAVLGITALLLQATQSASVGRRRRIIKFDADLANALPPESAGRRKLVEHIDTRVSRLVEYETEHRRNWPAIFIGLMAAGGVVLNVARELVDPSNPESGGWVGAAIILGATAIAFLGYGLPKVRRDENGVVVGGFSR